jgi:signal transduction histidine kinase
MLQSLDPIELRELGCTSITLHAGEVLQAAGDAEVYAFFPTTAVLSLMATMATGASTEIALVGREGMVGLRGVLSATDSTTTCVAQIGGHCFRTTTAALRKARLRSGIVRAVLDRYTTARLVQVAQAAACNRLHLMGSRLARWLLDLHDRVDGDAFKLSQQTIADSLGVHRPTIALELQRLGAAGAIMYRSRTVRVRDRARLEGIACECHGPLHRGYVDLFRPLGSVDAAGSPAAGGSASLEAIREIAGRLLITSLREQEARQLAEDANQAKDAFIAMVSHELRAPLQAILGWCALARLPHAPPGAIDVIERNARAQLRLLEDLLDSARITADTLQIKPATVQPVAVIEAALDTVRPAAEAKHVTLRLSVMDELSPLVADGDRLRQVMVNVLMNSVKFTEPGGCVEAELSSDDQRLAVRIRDTGRGIDREALPHVFEQFRQAGGIDANRHGLGLGLTIAKALVLLHGGTIELDSPGPEQGTVCTIMLPRAAAASSPIAAPVGSPK